MKKKESLFKSLVYLSLYDQPIIPQRASWVLDEITQVHPEWIYPFIEEMAESLENLSHSGARRNISKILGRSPLPKKNLGTLLNLCFEWMINRETAIAVRAHCMTLLYRISEIEPDIIGELTEVLSEYLEIGSAGERSRAKQILKKIQN